MKICPICGKEFEVVPSQLKVGKGKFCSKECYAESKKKNELKTCIICGKKFKGKLNQKYCSLNCSAIAQQNRIKRVCPICGKKFEITKYQEKVGKGKFCSRKCSDEATKLRYENQRIKRVCPICGKKFEITKYQEKVGKGKFCSKECASEGLSIQNSGSNAPAWKGGISFEPYCPKFNERFKENVRIFWGRKCGLCGKSEKDNGEKLAVHHVAYNKNACCDNSIPLFIPLCKSCHGKTNHNRKYWETYLVNYIMIWFDGESFTVSN